MARGNSSVLTVVIGFTTCRWPSVLFRTGRSGYEDRSVQRRHCGGTMTVDELSSSPPTTYGAQLCLKLPMAARRAVRGDTLQRRGHYPRPPRPPAAQCHG
jgi:hypothetical protein